MSAIRIKPHEAAGSRIKARMKAHKGAGSTVFRHFPSCEKRGAGRAKPSMKEVTPPPKGVYPFMRRSRGLSI